MKYIDTKLYPENVTEKLLIDILYSILCKESHEGDMTYNNMLGYLIDRYVEEKDSNVKDFFSRIFGVDIPASSIKKIIFERYLQEEGFNDIHWVDSATTDKVFTEQYSLARKIAVKGDSNIIRIIAPFYSTSEKLRCMMNDMYEWDDNKRITGSDWIYDVYVYDSMDTTFDDLYTFIKALQSVRWYK
jgi:hypothetical protein